MELNQRTRRSALWAAYGDALGFITELADESMVKRRTGTRTIDGLVPWTRRIGGKFGTDIRLPKGCYSDDTQLRLATSRSIRGNGEFDVEAFAKVELPVWSSYALGGGNATKCAAEQLCSPDSRWFSNFFQTKKSDYVKAGGNGAAMRIQPHAWCSPTHSSTWLLARDIIRNSVVTHGHPTGILGAVFHGLCLKFGMDHGRVVQADELGAVFELLSNIPKLIREDRELSVFWIPQWEDKASQRLDVGFHDSFQELRRDLDKAMVATQHYQSDIEKPYHDLLNDLGGFAKATLGSATKSAVFAWFLAVKAQKEPLNAISVAIHALGSDTDTIASMAGALIGCGASCDPPEDTMDKSYLISESDRLTKIAEGGVADSFRYPDLLYWRSPKVQLDAIGVKDGQFFVAGLGMAKPLDVVADGKAKDLSWQWFELEFGQRVLLRRRESPNQLSTESLPLFEKEGRAVTERKNAQDHSPLKNSEAKSLGTEQRLKPASVNLAADDVIKSNFDAKIIGAWLLRFANESEGGVDKAIAFAAIVAKAKNARMLRDSRKTN
ncbi:ADP-ribosyl-[dinitrogen reductase] glycohydrolase [Anatilimnocola aggregata]|uniref:ADP-ribosyl-[dinitrogen reductase] glycohydrolase n=1 Tax=Anatilimnocola aggregata TaxID=2528021 RepID=A0A517Y803_9BACT|nr:ADP-ribosylglycohydrolase family protein [Anatilimnocola aggregata]QDU26272.1 ADP-ribosyl-[dinitrogen reductase] glycohydrolase [Anatilimnocola aggregata]